MIKLIYKAKWVIVGLFPITFLISFVVLFVGGTANVNRWLLCANVLLIFAQMTNVVYAFKNKDKEVRSLIVVLLVNVALMWFIYIASWDYTVKALTVGFE